MFGLGTLINVAAIVAGGIIGLLFGRFINERQQESLCRVCGISTIFIAISGAMEGMLSIAQEGIVSSQAMFITICLALGTFVGELINIEGGFERFAKWLKIKTGNAKDVTFVDSFLTATFTVCIGAMAIVGSIQDGILGDYTILATKAILDFVIILVMTASMGKGCVFSAIPVLAFQGVITILAVAIKPLMTEEALANISLVGSILIFCVGVNLVWGKRINVANMLPALIFAVIKAFI